MAGAGVGLGQGVTLHTALVSFWWDSWSWCGHGYTVLHWGHLGLMAGAGVATGWLSPGVYHSVATLAEWLELAHMQTRGLQSALHQGCLEGTPGAGVDQGSGTHCQPYQASWSVWTVLCLALSRWKRNANNDASWLLYIWRVAAVSHPFSRCSRVNKWIFFPYSKGALYTTGFSLCPRAGKCAHGTPSDSLFCCIRDGVPIDTVSPSLLAISM